MYVCLKVKNIPPSPSPFVFPQCIRPRMWAKNVVGPTVLKDTNRLIYVENACWRVLRPQMKQTDINNRPKMSQLDHKCPNSVPNHPKNNLSYNFRNQLDAKGAAI